MIACPSSNPDCFIACDRENDCRKTSLNVESYTNDLDCFIACDGNDPDCLIAMETLTARISGTVITGLFVGLLGIAGPAATVDYLVAPSSTVVKTDPADGVAQIAYGHLDKDDSGRLAKEDGLAKDCGLGFDAL